MDWFWNWRGECFGYRDGQSPFLSHTKRTVDEIHPRTPFLDNFRMPTIQQLVVPLTPRRYLCARY
jgi:hypothetical protein